MPALNQGRRSAGGAAAASLAGWLKWAFAAFVWLAGLAYTLVSLLESSKDGQTVLHQVAALMDKSFSGAEVDYGEAKRAGSQLLRAASSSNLGLFCAANLAAGAYVAVGLATQALFLGGGLTAFEHSQLADRLLRFVLIKLVCLSSGAYGDKPVQWLGWAAVMAWASMFTRLAALRGEALLSSPSASLAQHARILVLLGGILAQDVSWIAGHVGTLGDGSWSHALLWLYDAAYVALDASLALLKYSTCLVDHARRAAAEQRGEEMEPWAGRSAVAHWLDVASDVALQVLTLGHSLHVWWLHGLQAQLVDGALFLEVRWLAAALQARLRGHARYCRLRRQLDTAFPDASARQLAADPCPICLEGMRAGKALPCSHVAHASCLAAWLQQSSRGLGSGATCPLCRASLDVQPSAQLWAGAQQRRWASQLRSAAGSLAHTAAEALLALQPAIAAQERSRRYGRAPARASAAHGGSSSSAAAGPAAASSESPGRRVTRLQARLAAAQAAGAAALPPPAASERRRTGRSRRRADSILDAMAA